jgi:thiamine biosynthesis lipoprotein
MRILISIVLGLIGVAAAAYPPALTRYEVHRLSMACTYDIAAYGDPSSDVPALLERALDEVDRVDRLMSHYKPESPLSQLNRTAADGAVVVDPELFEFIARSVAYSRDSHGAFDVTVGPLMKAWGFFKGDGRVPSKTELTGVMRRVGYRHVVLDRSSRTIRFDVAGVEIDLGGIAKGYAVDRVAALLREHGIPAALISAGGSTVYGLGHPPDRTSWEVKVQDPLEPSKIAFTVALENRALSMAGRSAKTFERNGVVYSHIMDPRTGRPVQGVVAVAVTSETGTEGDALDDALFVMGLEKSRDYLRQFPGSSAWLWLQSGKRARLVPL